ncbi:hypothetical protein CcNV_084 [Crangon crangon nudivirus]|uniref:Uncharacterized protein n=1 Tax=Crangon crangon nudivirus TaxID=2880838 RepID=A0AAE8Y268_9VIRU|nr:hypothetical protein QKT25_gp085 [Crangon crangon nudivirus]UBZ25569.1 hypothetical protein CcNV_084 [Crangon crangon nudivirus]
MAMLTDSNIYHFLVHRFPYLRINQDTATCLSTTRILNSNAYSWYMRAKCLQESPQTLSHISQQLDFNFPNLTLTQYIIAVTKNLKEYLQLFTPTHLSNIDLPLERSNHLDIIWPITYYALPVLDTVLVDREAVVECVAKVPMIGNQAKLKLHTMLDMKCVDVYYPTDSESYPNIRAVLYNIMARFKEKPIKAPKGTHIDNMTTKELGYCIIQSLPFISDKRAIEQFLKQTTITKDTKLGTFIHMLLDFLYHNKQIDYLQTLDENIIDNLNYDLYQIKPLSEIAKVKDKNSPICQDSITTTTLIKVLRSVPTIRSITELADICPIQIKYILSVFPYYDNEYLHIKNNRVLRKSTGVGLDESLTVASIRILSELRTNVIFDNNYGQFAQYIRSIPLSEDTIDNLSSAYYTMRGYRCATIVAEILSYHRNLPTSSHNKYALLSKLSSELLTLLDKESCKPSMEPPLDIITRMFVSYHPSDCVPFNTERIDATVKKMRIANTFEEKVYIASNYNYNIYILSRLLMANKDNKGLALCYMILIVYSNASKLIKRQVLDILPAHFNTDQKIVHKLPHIVQRPVPIASIDYDPTPYTTSITEGYDISNSIQDLISLMKDTKNTTLYNQISTIYYHATN